MAARKARFALNYVEEMVDLSSIRLNKKAREILYELAVEKYEKDLDINIKADEFYTSEEFSSDEGSSSSDSSSSDSSSSDSSSSDSSSSDSSSEEKVEVSDKKRKHEEVIKPKKKKVQTKKEFNN